MHPIQRRELLTAFLGLPLAAAACGRKSAQLSLPPGEIVFPSELMGHRVRGSVIPDIPEADRRRVSTVVVGAGPAGLSAAWRLKHAGVKDLVLLELDTSPGGTSKFGTTGNHSYPWGAHYITVPLAENRLLIRMLREFGTVEGLGPEGEPIVAEEQLCWTPDERIYYRGKWYDGLYLRAGANAEDERQYLAFRTEIEKLAMHRDGQGRRAFTIPIAYSSTDAEFTALDRISAAEWLEQKGFTSPRLKWLVSYACRDDYGALPENVSAWAAIFYFASRVRKMGEDPQAVITWPEGNGYLVKKLLDSVGDMVRLRSTVLDVSPSQEYVDLTLFDGATISGLRAERVVLAVPQYVCRHIVRPYRESSPAFLRDFEYGGWMVANLSLRGRPRETSFPLAWDNVLYDSPSLGYVVNTHQRGISHGESVFTYYYPLCDADGARSRERLLHASRDEWAEVALSELSIPHRELRSLVTRLDVTRWGHGMIRPAPGFMFGGSRARAARPLGRIHFGHSDLSGAALFEEAVYQGVRAAEEVLSAKGMLREKWA